MTPRWIPRLPAFLLAAVVVAGVTAAQLASPVLWLATPLVAGVILRAVVRDAALTAASGVDVAEFPRNLGSRVVTVMNRLPDGDARGLLLPVLAQARLLFARRESRFDAVEEQRMRDHVSGLVDACCTTAGDLARLDQFSSGIASVTAQSADFREKIGKARDLFRSRLTSAAEALATLYASGVEQGTPSTDRISELTNEIAADASARSTATTELRELLS